MRQAGNALERVDLDLSSWRAAANGSEPVRADTVRRFTERFAEVGFDPSAMAPCYGLAEATLVVSMSRPSSPVSFVSFDKNLLSQGIVKGIECGSRRDVGRMRTPGSWNGYRDRRSRSTAPPSPECGRRDLGSKRQRRKRVSQ